MSKMLRTCAVALFTILAASIGLAAIESLDLPDMVARADDAVVGRIVRKRGVRVDHPVEGRLYFTHLDVEGRSLFTGKAVVVRVTYLGGRVSEDEGAWCAEAPTADDTKIGNEVVVFHKRSDDLGGGLAGNGLYAQHGGLFRVVRGRGRPIVLGRGPGYAVSANLELSELTRRVAALRGGTRR